VVGTKVGLRLHLMSPGNAAALVAAGLLSVISFPIPGLRLLRGTDATTENAAHRGRRVRPIVPIRKPPGERARLVWLCSQLTQAVNLRRH
jgi:hypothetical protein